jgi:hypothetical protein
MQIDLHGYHPRDIIDKGVLREIVRQAWKWARHTCPWFMAMAGIAAFLPASSIQIPDILDFGFAKPFVATNHCGSGSSIRQSIAGKWVALRCGSSQILIPVDVRRIGLDNERWTALFNKWTGYPTYRPIAYCP